MPDQFWLPKRYAEMRRLAADNYSPGVEETALRVYKSSLDGVVVQWRVTAKNGKPGSGTITHGTLTIAQARELGRYLLSNFGTLSDVEALQQDLNVTPEAEG